MKLQDWQLLSAYLDNELSPQEKTSLEKRIFANPELNASLNELRQTKTLLHSIPNKKVPHNFTLTPEMVKSRSTPFSRLFPIFTFSSAAATVLLVISFVFQMGLGSPSATLMAVPQAKESLAEPAPTPMIIQWGAPQDAANANSGAYGLGGYGGGSDEPTTESAFPSESFSVMSEPEEMPAGAPPEDTMAPEISDSISPQELPSTKSAPILESAPESDNAEAPEMENTAPENSTTTRASEPISNPILGIAPTEEAGQINIPQAETSDQILPQAEQMPISTLTIVRILLGTIAVAAGIGAVILRRKY